MPPKNYKNLPSIREALFKDLVTIADKEGYDNLSQCIHDVLGAYVWMKKHGVPKEWLKK